MASTRLEDQVRFLLEIDKLKDVLRRTLVIESRRPENSAEHSWHLCMAAMLLAEHTNQPVDVLKAMKMAAIHDIVEVDAGDTYAYDSAGKQGQHAREARAADRIFGLLPSDQAAECRALWDEFEARETAEAKFANALDRFQAVLLNATTGGISWRQHGVTFGQVLGRLAPIRESSEALWQFAVRRVRASVEAGQLEKGPE